MTELRDLVKALRRPRLLVRAARIGVVDYNRDRDLMRVMRTHSAPSPAVAVRRLLDEENALDTCRLAGDATYSVPRHVDVLIALMAETKLLSHSTVDA